MDGPYRDIYHALNRALSGVHLDNYIKSGWQTFYTANAEDVRRLDDFIDGLNTLERNAQDALTLNLIRKALQHLPLCHAVLWVKHGKDETLTGIFREYLAQRLTCDLHLQYELVSFVIREWCHQAPTRFGDFVRRKNLARATAYTQREQLMVAVSDLYDQAVGVVESHLDNQLSH